METGMKRPKLTEQERAERKQNKIYDQQRKAENKAYTIQHKQNKKNHKREIAVLEFMKKTDVLYCHHGRQDSTLEQIKTQLQIMKTKRPDGSLPGHSVYHPYIWNHQGEGNNHIPRCQFGCIFSSNEFDSIYDVPLDGTYKFHIYDSGQRGLGSFNRITVTKMEVTPIIPKVNPGAFPFPITAN